MATSYKIIHYLNQFFGGLGGEDKASSEPCLFEEPRGPGNLLQKLFPEIEVIATLVSGDNYVVEHTDAAVSKCLDLLRSYFKSTADDKPVMLFAGPAFNAGRYGLACGAICKAVEDALKIPVVSSMFPQNPAVNEYREDIYISEAGEDVMSMEESLSNLGSLGLKILKSEELLPAKDHYIPRGIRKNYFHSRTGAVRAVDMLLNKLTGVPFDTEYPMPTFDRVEPAPAVKDMAKTKLALVTSGGIVPKGNPDRIAAANAQRFGTYALKGLSKFTSETHQTAHGGYDPTFANANPNRVLPLDAIRELVQEGAIGSLHGYYYATVGNATSVANARSFGKSIAEKLVADGVQAAILTST